MNSLAHDYPEFLLAKHESPCISIYQPTHRSHPDNAPDPIRFRNLVRQAEKSLRKKYTAGETSVLLRPFEKLAEDRLFWNHTGCGLAVLGGRRSFRVYRLQRPVAELSVVANSFHTKPLMRIVQSADSYQILGLHRNAFKVFEGNRDGVHELEPVQGVPQTAAELLGEVLEGPDRTSRVYGSLGSFTQHGTDIKQEAEKHNTKRFFRAVDQTVLKHYTNPSGLPLILAALPEHHHLFHSVSRNPQLTAAAIDVHPDNLSSEALRERAWQLALPRYLEKLATHVEAFGKARASGKGADRLSDIAAAALAGRVATLLIEADRLIPGYIDTANGNIIGCELVDPGVDDVLDDLGELVLKAGGEVVIVPAERMPTQTGAAAIYRF